MIELKNVSKSYNGNLVLDNINLKINKGEFVVLTGESGCGKSTLLNIIGLIDECDKGEIFINNISAKKLGSDLNSKLIRNNISYLFQNYALVEDYSIKDNFLIALKYSKHSKDEKEKLMNSVIKLVNLNLPLDKPVYECSGGEQQRIALARAILKPCNIILCDEPTGNLDSKNAKIIIDLLRLINNNYHKTIVIVTHDNSLLQIADKHYNLSK